MTDRELLELAAKAARIEWKPADTDAGRKCELKFGLWLVIDGEPSEYQRRRWNPLTDDGDALRLAVKLQLAIAIDPDQTWAHHVQVMMGSVEPHGTNPFAATRRAIVRAAAEIGRNMK